MTEHDACEQAYRNGYEAGKEAGTPKWIPVTERMPEDGTKVLALAKNGRISECDCVKSYVERFGNYEQLTHWMPRPELPKEV